jgi:hypothetical protein
LAGCSFSKSHWSISSSLRSSLPTIHNDLDRIHKIHRIQNRNKMRFPKLFLRSS